VIVCPAMRTISYGWKSGDIHHALQMVHVEGTNDRPYSFADLRTSEWVKELRT
jgi:hypothetical protein